jgi:hypothetical protein
LFEALQKHTLTPENRMTPIQSLTGVEAGLSGDMQIRIALKAILENGGNAPISLLYKAVERQMNGAVLSEQGKASFRYYINRVATRAGLVFPHNPGAPGWKITAAGKEFLGAESAPEEVINVDTEKLETILSNSARGAAFESYILELLKKVYPDYAWYQQGIHKSRERGLDFIGTRIGNLENCPQFIGVQVKFHAQDTAPSQLEWFKFLAGCFARRIDQAIFITTGQLTSEQRREAGEARVIVVEGRGEVYRIASHHNLKEFELFDES